MPENDGCVPKGLCGLNGYCVLNDRDIDCKHLLGFARVKEGDWGSGCERNFTVESCSASSEYAMKESNTEWENDTYSLLTSSTNENCREACLQDCNYEAIKKIVAVKRLDKSMLAERERQFHTEMKVIGRTHYKNLVHLLGYCHDGPNRLLVYKYMSNGSLVDKLITPEKRLSWAERIKIACNIVRRPIYLHEECEPKIIHYDIKPHNILIDEDGCTKISDFRLAKLLNAAQTKTFT
ncbi:G-type lectin S-receptor-like serine/threonine-protein kinase LECRK4 [Corylus avellana]|uniref:G-type lectin S-receptor-like serine/threonine-protein kinase LECRK4 n=1 Tax=Corylus avellana TaxID=13451 RepID=UPI00286BF12D|nr:G-type lectin S-receptor-like serine/threonine-protein kinase LECRK4 [Corylus avellana]